MQRITNESRPHQPADDRNFVMPALTQRLLGGQEAQPVRLYRVTFREGARTYWHSHDDVQLLFGISGACVVVNRDGDEMRLEPGDVVVIGPGEEHWHGAAPGSGGEHLAINVGSETTWLESSA